MAKKTVKIAHLYYDILNLYGENGNVRALVKYLEKHGVKVVVEFLSLEDKIKFEDYDFVYIGSGTIENILLVLEDLRKYAAEIKNAINNGVFFLITGDSLAMFGKKFVDEKHKYDGLGIFDYVAKRIDFRILGDQFYECPYIEQKVIGFQNRETVIDEYNGESLFNVSKGTGYKPNIKQEGIIKNNFWGTYSLGPILVRNPYLNEYLVKKLMEKNKIKYSPIEKDISYKAYEEYWNNFGEN